jgi:hypothetical protein
MHGKMNIQFTNTSDYLPRAIAGMDIYFETSPIAG